MLKIYTIIGTSLAILGFCECVFSVAVIVRNQFYCTIPTIYIYAGILLAVSLVSVIEGYVGAILFLSERPAKWEVAFALFSVFLIIPTIVLNILLVIELSNRYQRKGTPIATITTTPSPTTKEWILTLGDTPCLDTPMAIISYIMLGGGSVVAFIIGIGVLAVVAKYYKVERDQSDLNGYKNLVGENVVGNDSEEKKVLEEIEDNGKTTEP